MDKSRDKDPLGRRVSYQGLQALLHPKNMSCFCAGAQLQRAGESACLLVWCRPGENWEGSPISWVIWQEGCWMSQHFRWQWKAWSRLVFGRLLWVSSLGVEPFAWDVKGAVLTLSPHLPCHHTPARHSCEGVPCALAQQGSPGMCVFGKCLLCCLPYTLNNIVWELGKQLLLLGSAA